MLELSYMYAQLLHCGADTGGAKQGELYTLLPKHRNPY